MVRSIKQLFPLFRPEDDMVEDTDFRNRGKIIELFRALKDENTILKIRLPEAKREYTSNIIDLDEKTLCFRLDEIFPEDGHTLFSRSGTLIAHAQVRGVNVSFTTSLIQADNSGQFRHYLCDIPESISYMQRRVEYRVLIRTTHLVQVSVQHEPSQQILRGNVHDISLQGIGIFFKTSHIIKPADQLICCKLPLGNNDVINFSLDVRHIESKSPDTIRVGGKFKDLDARSSEIIGRFVREMERMVIQR